MNKKVLILSAAVGAGHLRAAEAIEKEFKLRHPTMEIKNIDVLDYTNPLFRRLYGKAYSIWSTRCPKSWAGCTIHSTNPGKTKKDAWL